MNTNIIRNKDASEKEVVECLSQIEESDYYLCRVCVHFSKCQKFAFKTLVMKLKESQND